MDVKLLEQGIEQYPTPFYVFNIDEILSTFSLHRGIWGEKIGLCYAMKANPFLVKKVEPFVDRIEVCSMGEYRICKAQGIAPEKMYISGVLKRPEDFAEILERDGGKVTYTAESLQQYMQLKDWCDETGEAAQVYLRLTSGNQFGMDEDTIRDILDHRRSPYLTIKGIHFFSGTQKKGSKKIIKELTYLDEFLLGLAEAGHEIEDLEYGTGLAIQYFDDKKDTTVEDAQAVAQAIADMKWKGYVTLEMGRALAANGGYYLTKISDVKRSKDKRYCIVDGGIHQINYDGQIRGMYQPRFQITPSHDGEAEGWTVCGSLCTTNDVLMQKVELTNPQVGDVLIFEQTGAYSVMEGMALFLSHELPTVTFYSEERKWELIREERQTYTYNMEER